MPNTTSYKRGDIFLVEFVFSEGTGMKKRPAVLVSSNSYNAARKDVIVAGVTTDVTRLLVGDHLLANWREAGLLHPSVVTGIISTIKQDMVGRRIGSLSEADIRQLNRVVQATFGLPAILP
ncbi:MAG: type II toxin-antitoxin system PemK/MazF family toxin [SAR202 cluster bacterium]|nr:type II toxin-antitoxin system PemK/MazF family toxin [SAR202 cluster bacterium]